MLDLTECDPALLQLPDTVVADLVAHSTKVRAEDVMIVGAHCRDILRSALGQDSGLRTTEDIDFGLAIADWAAYSELTEELKPTGNTGIRYRIADVPTDLMPFGDVERPPGTVTPPARREPMSVWGFAEVFHASCPLVLPNAGTIRIPTLAGYAALKLAAWLDRSAYGKFKDASDLATVLYWYAESPRFHAALRNRARRGSPGGGRDECARLAPTTGRPPGAHPRTGTRPGDRPCRLTHRPFSSRLRSAQVNVGCD